MLFSCKSKTQVEENGEYKYSGVKFVSTDELTYEAAAVFVPAGADFTFKSLSDLKSLEKYITDNLDVYSIEKITDGGRVRIYLKPIADKIVKQGDKFVFTLGETESNYAFDGSEAEGFTLKSFAGSIVKGGFEKLLFANGALEFEIEITLGWKIIYLYR